MYLCNRFKAQMAESVDALVSNTSGATHPGSSPGLGTDLKATRGCVQIGTSSFYAPLIFLDVDADGYNLPVRFVSDSMAFC